jgi:hypothetical protein
MLLHDLLVAAKIHFECEKQLIYAMTKNLNIISLDCLLMLGIVTSESVVFEQNYQLLGCYIYIIN